MMGQTSRTRGTRAGPSRAQLIHRAAAGGRTLGADGALLAYGKPGFLNPAFLATGPYDCPPLQAFL